jgi:quinol monooxygenase YgiN
VIIITGSIIGSTETVDELEQLALEHVRRSRQEPGCLSHTVFRDAENPLRLFFYEQWSDLDAVRTHFAVPESGAYVAAAARLCESPPVLELFDSTPVKVR